ncbi:MAG: VCBS repeat-containing protein, partial [bacterium]
MNCLPPRRILFVLTLLPFVVCAGIASAETAIGVRLVHNNPGLVVDLGVGLWAVPLPMDWDNDGDNDLVVSSAGMPCRGVYFFENDGSGIFQPGKRLDTGKANVTVSYLDDGPVVCEPNKAYPDFRNTLYENPQEIPYEKKFYSGRTNQWKYVDYDGDAVYDLIIGVSDWRDYGWDNAYDSNGNWTHGPIHGNVYWIKNLGTNESPRYGEAIQIRAGNEPVNVFGCPSPNFVDWDGDGDLDLICGEFLDRIIYFENTGTRTKPVYQPGRFLESNGQTIHLELEMLQVVVLDWDKDDDPDIIVGKEDGRVVLIENTGVMKNGLPELKPPTYFRQHADSVKCGALVTPFVFDWDDDGDDDIIEGNTAGFLEWVENLDGKNPPKWSEPRRLEADGKTIRIMAGPNLSIQGPAEAKWGYTVPYIADWDMDGLPDIVINTIVGKIEWYRNIGTRKQPRLAAAQPVEVEWNGPPPKPAWNWWNPAPKELVVQWRTRPVILDLNHDGLNDLIIIDHEGYLSFFERERRGDNLILHPGKRIFLDEERKPLCLNDGEAGKSGRRKIDLVDWDADGDLDMLINSPKESPAETRNIALYENIGEKDAYVFKYHGDITKQQLEGHTTCPTTTDWNKDGVRDLLVGAE